MSQYTIEVRWNRGTQDFTDLKYSRKHTWRLDGGVEIPASSSPHSVPLPYSAADALDPEEAFVGSLSSCHMLWFLFLAAKRGFVVDGYQDQAFGILEKNEMGKVAMTKVVLRPKADFSGDKRPTRAELSDLHEQAHEECFIANSVRTDVRCDPVFERE